MANGRLKSHQDIVLASMLGGTTIHEAAALVGVDQKTVYRWIYRDEAFAQQWREIGRAMLKGAIADVQSRLHRATQCFVDVIDDPKSPHAARVSAANSIWTFALRGHELGDLTARLEALEAQAQRILAMQGHSPGQEGGAG